MTESSSGRSHQRVSPEEREEAAERIRLAAGEGRLTVEELEARLETALSALTYGDLDVLVDDLPDSRAPGVPATARIAISNGHVERIGLWQIPRRLNVELGSASAYLDLRTAAIPPGGLQIHFHAVMSKIVLAVPSDASVVADELGQHRGKIVERGRRDAPNGAVIRLTGDLWRSKVTVKRPG
jgi:hypothetical protein